MELAPNNGGGPDSPDTGPQSRVLLQAVHLGYYAGRASALPLSRLTLPGPLVQHCDRLGAAAQGVWTTIARVVVNISTIA